MDFRNVTGVTIPAGNVNKISIGGVVFWKKSNNKYKIIKDGVQLAEVTMSDLVSQVNSGVAQEDYGIGAQLIVPYTDAWDGVTYDLPFNFGTFIAYGQGTLGLQAHYAVPAQSTSYSQTQEETYLGIRSTFYSWKDSYAYKWLNACDSEHGITDTPQGLFIGKNGFLGCLPEDFVDAMNITTHGREEDTAEMTEATLVSGKIFLPGATNISCEIGDIETYKYHNIISAMAGDGENTVWEYWQNKIGHLQTIDEILSERRPRMIYNISLYNDTNIPIPNRSYVVNYNYYTNTVLTSEGRYLSNSLNSVRYLPACVIG